MTDKPDIQQILNSFETKLIPASFISGVSGGTVIGYGEISSVLSLRELPGLALKRMPLFTSRDQAETYITVYNKYCRLLEEAGLSLPKDSTYIIEIPGRPVVLYLQQTAFPADRLAHRLIHQWPAEDITIMFKRILAAIEGVWRFSEAQSPQIRVGLDAQLSNWIVDGNPRDGRVYYIDTSTPLFRLNETEQLNPELFLKSSMPGLRWVIRKFFLKEVIDRYYDKRSVLIDLAANLYKEQCPHLIPVILKLINDLPGISHHPITQKEIRAYYQEDKRIWEIVQVSRKIHRWGVTKIKRGRYEFILPGAINR